MVVCTVDMETRTRKRMWQSSPDKKRARTSLDFDHVENTPPKKQRLLLSTSTDTESSNDEETKESFNIKSFYGGREKKHFPHSPGRRKAASKILAKLSDDENEDVTSSEELLSLKTDHKIFTNHKSDQIQESLTSVSKLSVLRSRNRRYSLGNVGVSSSLDKQKACTSPAPSKSVTTDTATSAVTPANTKKFFKHKSPASADKAVGSIIVRKGFDLKFLPKRYSVSNMPTPAEKKKSTQKHKDVKKILTASGKKPTYRPLTFDTRNHNGKTAVVPNGDIETTVTDSACSSASPEDFSTVSSPSSVSVADRGGDNGSVDLFSVGSDISSGCNTPSSMNISESLTDTSSLCSGPTLRNKPLASVSSSLSSSPANKKFFSIFSSQETQKLSASVNKLQAEKLTVRRSPRNIRRRCTQRDDEDQMILDAGQKKFGATQCEECGMVYSHADPTDETTHAKFHQSFMNALKFSGWKKERVVQEYPMDGGRVLMVNDDDSKYAVKKVEEVNKIMGQEMGFPEPTLAFRMGYKAFLYISEEKRIEGCCIAEPVTEGYRVIADSQPSQSSQPGHRPWCCQSSPEPAVVGVSRIWVYNQQRRKGVATKLLDSVRQWFEYGVFIEKDQMAFSDPTPDGKQLATRYTGTPSFLVYKYT